MKKIIIIILFCAVCLTAAGCGSSDSNSTPVADNAENASTATDVTTTVCAHEWEEATCQSPAKCKKCAETKGDVGDHTWIEATCTKPKTCSICGLTEGESLGHDAPGLSCTQGSTCKRCGIEISELGHKWEEATCTKPKTCSRCKTTEGSALGHTKSEAKIENQKLATCTEDGLYDEVVYCTVCNEELSRETKTEKAYGHTTSNGVCSRCGMEFFKTVIGHGDDVISNISVGDGPHRVHFTNSGDSNFAVWVHDDDRSKDLAVNEIGNYDGYYYLSGKAPFIFEIESNGVWSYTIESIGTTSATSFDGKGCYVTDSFSSKTGTWHITHNGSSNFAIWLYTTDGRDLIVNEIGKYDGKKRFEIPSGSKAILSIEADGYWSITPVD